MAARERFPDGIAFVDLAPLADPGLVPSAVAWALGLREQGDQPALDLVRAHLRGRRLLLVLDNCEHLLAAGPALAGLLADARAVRLLVTSRAPLRLAGEQEYPVSPLTLPEVSALAPAGPGGPAAADAPRPQDLLRAEAVRLFVERARAARPAFALTPENAAAVAELCRRLDGLPLAIELAAARVRHAPPPTLLARLEPRLLLLTAGARDAPARHRTLGAMLDWSHDLLSDAERALFRRLGVFAGGFTLEAAEAVCAGGDGDENVHGGGPGGLAPGAVFDLLCGLVDQSLVVAAEREGDSRYRLLETVREYALDHLERAGEVGAVRRRHLRWYLRLTEEWHAGFRGPGQRGRLGRLAAELDNLRAALDWAASSVAGGGRSAATPATDGSRSGQSPGEIDGLRLAAALRWFWIGVGIVQEGRDRTGALLDLERTAPWGGPDGPAPDRPERAGPRAGALAAAGHLALVGGDFAEAEARFREGLPLWRQAGDERGRALALAFLGMILRYRLDLDEAEARLTEARDAAACLGDRPARYWAAHGLALVRRARGDGPGAVALDEEALAIAETDGDPGHVPVSQILLASSLQVAGDLARARRLLTASLGRADEYAGQLSVVPRLVGFATLAAREGQPERALRLAGATAALRAQTGAVFSGATVAFDPALAAAARALGEASAAAAFAAGQAMSPERALAEALAPPPPRAAAPGAPGPEGRGREALPAGLTAREAEVLRLLAAHHSNREIADALVLSVRTVERHVSNLYTKIRAHDRRSARAYAVLQGLAGPA
jgi:non-specific serine/threonine protein kinase